jgi:DNA polymerase I
MGITKLKKDFGYTEEEAEDVFSKYFDNVPCVKSTMKVVSDKFIERGYVITIAGRHFHLHSEDEAYKGINGLDQGSSADMTKRAIVMAWDRGLWSVLRFYTTVHDELDFQIPETKKAVKAALEISDIMSKAYLLNVPVFVTPEAGLNWYDAADDNAETRFKYEINFRLTACKFRRMRNCRRYYLCLRSR